MHAPTLLIVDDEERMRRLFELVLKAAGYQLLLARSGDEALHMLQEHDSIDMIITDLQLGT
ncbi:MAG: response regulator, partial [Nitrospira sp.]|nr:response regulator [Nitrospira sp.]